MTHLRKAALFGLTVSSGLAVPAGLMVVGSAKAQPATQPGQSSNANLVNAAQPKYGTTVTVQAGPGVVKDRNTSPDAYLDSNPHSRYVLTGAPYTITVELPFKTRIEKISFSQTDLPKEVSPKELEITFDDGQTVQKTLDLSRPQRVRGKMQAAWQDVPVGREIKSFKVKVLSNYDGEEVKFGGLGDIAVWTTSNLDEKFRLVNYDAKAPVYIHTAASTGTGAGKVTLPPVAAPGEHPRLLFTPQELAEFKAKLPQTERGKTTLANFLKLADTYAGQAMNFPTPEDTAAEKAGKEHNSLSYRAGGLGLAYGLTGDVKYAKAAREILTGYAQRYDGYPRHSGRNKSDSSKVTFQRLSEAMWLIPQIQSYDYIYHSGVLSDSDKKLIENGLIRPAILEIRRREPAQEAALRTQKDPNWRTTVPELAKQGEYPNWLNFYNTATLMAGSVMDDKDMKDLAAADFRTAIATGIGADGLWGEGAIGYQLFAMAVMVPGFEVAARNGYDLWNVADGRFKTLFDSPLRYAYPDGTMPGINDSGRGKLGSWQTMVYDYGYLRYGDPRYAFLLNSSPRQLHFSEGIYLPTRVYENVPEPASVSAGSTLFGSMGYSILRDSGKYALMDYGPHGGVHGHYDKLNLILFAAPPGTSGDEMGGEPVFHDYANPLHGEWTTQTVAHNTLTVDQKSQMAGDGKLLVYEATPGVKLMRAESVGSYPGVILDRTVIATPSAVIDLYHGSSTLDHTWDRTFRFGGKLAELPALTAEAKPLGESAGYQHIQVAAQQGAMQQWGGTWNSKVGKFNVSLAGAPTQQLILGLGPDKDEMALARQIGKTADFGAVYALDSWNNPVQKAQWLTKGQATENGASVFEMTQKDGTISRVIVAHNPGHWQALGWKSDARVLYIQQKGADTQVLLGGGTFAQNGAMEVRQGMAGNILAQSKGAKLETISTWAPTGETTGHVPTQLAQR